VATIITPPATSSALMRRTCFFHQGRVSFTSYAMFSASISAPKMFDPDHPASSTPIDMIPALPLDVTISPSTLRSSESVSAGMVPESRPIIESISCCPFPTSPSIGVRNSRRGKSEKKK
jgi:hypothetical protein